MRTLNSLKNMLSSVGISLVMILLGFFTRKLFVDNIGVQYLGLNGLLSNILGVTSLLEGGFATSVVYNMYKPIAENNHEKIIALLQLYRKVYRYIALGIFLFALILYPFIGYFIKGADSLQYVSVVYFIFVFNSLIGYFTAYKWSIINASQKNYKLALTNLVYQVGLNFAKLAVLYYTRNYILFLVVESLFSLGLNVAVVRKANQLFPYIVTKKRYIVEDDIKKNIIQNMKYIFIINIGTYLMHSTDNIVISSYVGISIVGLYSNYTLISGIVSSMARQILNSFSDSVGDLVASESSNRVYEVYKTVFFVNFLVISIPSIIMYTTFNPFINWWLGNEYTLPNYVVGIIIFNFYIMMMRDSAITFKGKSGIFFPDRYTTLIQGIINLVLSLLLVQYLDLFGVLLATALSVLAIGFWQYPRICYKYIFHQPLWSYFKQYIKYTAVAVCALVLSIELSNCYYIENQLMMAITNGIVSILVIISLYYFFFHKTTPFRTLFEYVKLVGFKS